MLLLIFLFVVFVLSGVKVRPYALPNNDVAIGVFVSLGVL